MATAEKPIWFQSSREQLDALLLEVCDGLQLRPSRHELAVERYGTVNEILEKAGSPFRFLRPRIFPQGSMALGTTCKPVEGPHDLDFVLQIDAPHWRWHPLAGSRESLAMSQQSRGFHPVVSQQLPDAHAEGDGKGEACSGAGGCSRKGTAAACGATAEALAGSRICGGVPRADFRCSHDVGRHALRRRRIGQRGADL